MLGKKMTDEQNEIDLAKEIEELDGFLDEQEADYPLDEDDGDFGPPAFASNIQVEKEKKTKKKMGLGQFMGYLFFLCVLFGGSYAIYIFAPRFIEKPQLEKVQNFVSNESGDIIGDLTTMFKSYIPTSNTQKDKIEDNKDIFVVDKSDINHEPVDVIADLPMPSDQGLSDTNDMTSISSAVDFLDDTNDAVDNSTVSGKQTDGVVSDSQVSNVKTSDFIPDLSVVDVEPINEEVIVLNQSADENLEDDLTGIVADDMVPNPPVADLKPIEVETVEVAQEINEMPKDDLIEIVEELDNVTAKEVVEIAEDMGEEKIPTAPKIEKPVIVVETKKAVPVNPVSRASTPKKLEKPTRQDSRVSRAKTLFDQGDYNASLSLYQEVLQSDPTNTSALTGRQLAQAKLRMSSQMTQASKSIDKKTSHKTHLSTPVVQNQVPSSPVANTRATVQLSGNVQSLLQQAQANPNDASLAFEIGNAYKNSDKTKAMEWYRKALKIDVLYSSGIDRMAVYDAMADIQ